MSMYAHEERDIENMQADFDMFLAQNDWKNAQAIIDNLRGIGQDHLADILRKAYLKKQYEVGDVVENDFVYEPIEEVEPPLLEACWFEGSLKKYDEADRQKMEDSEAQYQALRAQVASTV